MQIGIQVRHCQFEVIRRQGSYPRKFPFERNNSLQCYELTRRYSNLLFTQISPLTYAVYLWPVHCECAMKQNRRQIFNHCQIRDMI